MFDMMDIISSNYSNVISFAYFFPVMLIIGLLGRNVFIAVITDAFDDLRVMLSEKVSQVSRREAVHTHVLRKVDKCVKLVHVEEVGSIHSITFNYCIPYIIFRIYLVI